MIVEAHHNAASTESEAGTMPSATEGTPSLRVSTGVTGPRLISEPALKISAADFEGNDPGLQHVVVAFTVNREGKPKNVHLLKSVNQSIDGRIMAAVRGYRFVPATLSGQTIAMKIEMTVNFEVKRR